MLKDIINFSRTHKATVPEIIISSIVIFTLSIIALACFIVCSVLIVGFTIKNF